MDALLMKKDAAPPDPVRVTACEPDGGLSRWLRRVATPTDAGRRNPLDRRRVNEKAHSQIMRQPVGALGIALALGFLGGIVWARR